MTDVWLPTYLKCLVGFTLAFSQARAGDPPRTLELKIADGGSMVTQLSAGIAVNKGSSLHRRWVILNDTSCPVKLGTIGIVPVYRSERYSGSYEFVIKGDATAVTDLWGLRDRGLEAITVTDIAAGLPIPTEGSWYATENDVERIFTTVAYVDQVMLPDGKIWTANRAAVAAKLSVVQLKVTEAALDPDPPKAPPVAK
jgi:hypothetical protein